MTDRHPDPKIGPQVYLGPIKMADKQLFSFQIGVAYSLSVYLMTRTWFNIKEWLTTE